MSDNSEYKCSLSAETLEKAKVELNEDPETRLIEVKTLRQRLEKVPGLVVRKDTPFLLQFLRARKFDQEKAYQLVKAYYENRRDNPDVFDDIKPSRIRQMEEDGILEVLKHRNKNGCKVIVVRPASWDPDRYSILTMPKATYLTMTQMLEEEETQVNGVHIIVNMANMTLRQCTPITPSIAKKFVHILQDSLPLRLKRYDYINEPTFFDIVFAVIRPFLKEKLASRLFLNGTKFDGIHKVMDPEHLPVDVGGELPIHHNKEWMDHLMTCDAKYEEDNKYGFVKMGLQKDDKVSRSGDAGMQGLGGTFKKLEI